MKNLIITEKPSQAKALISGLKYHFKTIKAGGANSKTLNIYYESDYEIIVAARGHLFELYSVADYLVDDGVIPLSKDGKYNWRDFKSEIPYIPVDFKVRPKKGFCEAQFKLIKNLISRSDVGQIYNLGDPDAEGELLIREILTNAGNSKPVLRIETKSLVPEAIVDAYRHPFKSNNYNHLYFEALARQQTDWLTGINYTTMLTLSTGCYFPIGRVMYPIIRFVYDSDKAIEEFVSEKYYGVKMKVRKDGKNISISSSTPEIRFKSSEKDLCSSLCTDLNNQPTVVTSVETKKKNLSPKKLFSTSKLLAEMSSRYKLSIDETTAICQKLYDDGRIYYPRTDCEYLQSSEIDNTRKTIESLERAGYPVKFHTKKSVFNDEKCGKKGEGGHTAIIITGNFFSDEEFDLLDYKTQAVYSAIFDRTISNFCDSPDIDETKVVFTCGEYNFSVTGCVINKLCFLEFEQRSLPEELPNFYKGEALENVKYVPDERKTKAPPKATESRLLYYLKHPFSSRDEENNATSDENDSYYEDVKKGVTIGTDATTAGIIKKTISAEYITYKKGVYSITEKGSTLVEMLDKMGLNNLSAERTVEMNKTIKAIGNGFITLESNKANIRNELYLAKEQIINSGITISSMNTKTNSEVGKCPKCGNAVYEGQKAFSCSNKNCDFYLYKEDAWFKKVFDKKITKTIAKGLLSKNRRAIVKNSKTKRSSTVTVDFSGKYPAYDFLNSGRKD